MSHKIKPLKSDVPWVYLVLTAQRRLPDADARLYLPDGPVCMWPVNDRHYPEVRDA